MAKASRVSGKGSKRNRGSARGGDGNEGGDALDHDADLDGDEFDREIDDGPDDTDELLGSSGSGSGGDGARRKAQQRKASGRSREREKVAEKTLATPTVVVRGATSSNLPAARRTTELRKPGFSLLDLVANNSLNLPRKYKEEKSFFRFLRKASTDKVLIEAVNRFRDAVLLSSIGGKQKRHQQKGGLTIAVAGPSGGEGSSFLSLMLALTLGNCAHRRVAIMDGQFNQQRFRALTDIFGLARNSVTLSKGASQILGYYNESQPNVYFLKNASAEREVDFFSDKQLNFFLSDLRQQFDFTIIDTPPLLKGTSGIFLAPSVDRLYLVGQTGKTRQMEIERSIDLVQQAGGEVTGVVLNHQKTPLWSKVFWREFFY